MEKGPNYVGVWGDGNFYGLNQYSERLPSLGPFFHFFIKEHNGEEIKGKIRDIYGEANFSGNLTSSRLNFEKRYSEEAIKNGGAPGKIFYSGLRRKIKISEFSNIKDLEIVVGIFEYEDPIEMMPKIFVMSKVD